MSIKKKLSRGAALAIALLLTLSMTSCGKSAKSGYSKDFAIAMTKGGVNDSIVYYDRDLNKLAEFKYIPEDINGYSAKVGDKVYYSVSKGVIEQDIKTGKPKYKSVAPDQRIGLGVQGVLLGMSADSVNIMNLITLDPDSGAAVYTYEDDDHNLVLETRDLKTWKVLGRKVIKAIDSDDDAVSVEISCAGSGIVGLTYFENEAGTTTARFIDEKSMKIIRTVKNSTIRGIIKDGKLYNADDEGPGTLGMTIVDMKSGKTRKIHVADPVKGLAYSSDGTPGITLTESGDQAIVTDQVTDTTSMFTSEEGGKIQDMAPSRLCVVDLKTGKVTDTVSVGKPGETPWVRNVGIDGSDVYVLYTNYHVAQKRKKNGAVDRSFMAESNKLCRYSLSKGKLKLSRTVDAGGVLPDHTVAYLDDMVVNN